MHIIVAADNDSFKFAVTQRSVARIFNPSTEIDQNVTGESLVLGEASENDIFAFAGLLFPHPILERNGPVLFDQ